MTVSSTVNKIVYAGDGSTKVFAYTFIIKSADHLYVYLKDTDGNETLLTRNTHYTVSGVGNPDGGNVTMIGDYDKNPPESGYSIILVRIVPLTQLVDYVEHDKFHAEVHEGALDQLTMALQQFNEQLARAIKLKYGTSFSDVEMEDPTANKYLYYDGSIFKWIALTTTALSVTTYIESLLDDDDSSEALQTLKSLFCGVIEKTGDYTVQLPDRGKQFDVDASGGNVKLTLPVLNTAKEGFAIPVRKVDTSANTVTIDGNGAETVDGAADFVLRTPGQYVLVVAGAGEPPDEWHVFGVPVGIDYNALTDGQFLTYDAANKKIKGITNPSDDLRKGWKDNCVNRAPVDSDGLADFISIGSGLAVDLDGTPTAIECIIDGKYGMISSDTSISGLTASSTCYLYFEQQVSAEEITTKGHSVVRPFFGFPYTVSNITQTQHDTWYDGLRYDDTFREFAQSLPAYSYPIAVTYLKWYLKQLGTIPSGDVWCEIQELNSSGQPSGTPITNGISNKITASTIAADPGDVYSFTFTTHPILDPRKRYGITIKGDYPLSTVNYLNIKHKNADVFSGGHMHRNNAGTWGNLYVDRDWYFEIGVTIETDQHWFDLSVMKMKRYTGAAWEDKKRIFVGEAVTDGSSVTSVVNYALRRRFITNFVVAASTDYEKTHDIGLPNYLVKFILKTYEVDGSKTKPIVIDVGGTNGIYFKSPTDVYKKIKIRTATNPIRKDDDSGWATAGYVDLVAEGVF